MKIEAKTQKDTHSKACLSSSVDETQTSFKNSFQNRKDPKFLTFGDNNNFEEFRESEESTQRNEYIAKLQTFIK